jgi:fatty acid desaturase
MNSRTKVTDLFSREEIKMLTTKSDLMGAWAVGSTWAVIGLTFASVAWVWPQVGITGKLLVCILALIILGGRQLALGIITHDASHSTLFKTQWLNDHLVDWLCARPVWNKLHNYRPYHLRHHAKTSTPDDPDLSLVAGLPTTQRSLIRKFVRDISGITGIKFVAGRILMDLGVIEWTVTNEIKRIPQAGRTWWSYPLTFIKNSGPAMMTNAVIFALMWVSGHPWLYALWLLAYITPFPLFIRIRSMAEHAATEKTTDVLKNTRSTRAGYIARALVAPINVNFHIEHHLMASVPYFRLPLMHKMLLARGYVQKPPNYFDVFKIMSSKSLTSSTASTSNH